MSGTGLSAGRMLLLQHLAVYTMCISHKKNLETSWKYQRKLEGARKNAYLCQCGSFHRRAPPLLPVVCHVHRHTDRHTDRM